MLLNIIDFGMIAAAGRGIAALSDRALLRSFANHEFMPGKLNLETGSPKATADALAALGHKVTVAGMEQFFRADRDRSRMASSEAAPTPAAAGSSSGAERRVST